MWKDLMYVVVCIREINPGLFAWVDTQNRRFG
jgi:hypothetical protein